MKHGTSKIFPAAVLSILLLGIVAVPCGASGQDQSLQSMEESVARTGVFFRADAPWVLRNPNDPYLPVVLEIINGVEKAGLSRVAELARKISRSPLELEGVRLFVKPSDPGRQFAAEPLLLGDGKDFTWDAREGEKPLVVADRMEKTLEVPLGAMTGYLNHHFIGGPFSSVDLRVSFSVRGWPEQNTYLRVKLDAPPLPHLSGWYRGDLHYHSAFTDNPAERGYPLGVTKQVAIQAGFDWILLTDHSTDLNPERYEEELRQATEYSDGRFVFIRGEELTVSSMKDVTLGTVHLIALPSPEDPDAGFPASPGSSDRVIMTGDGSVTSPAMPLAEALARIAAAGGFAYAAHPFDPISPVLRGGSWDLEKDFLAPDAKNLRAGLVGVEAWNRATTATADDARDPYCLHLQANPASCFQADPAADQYARIENGILTAWLPLLRKGLELSQGASASPAFKVFLGAGSDAHGDFNYEATMDVTDFVTHPFSRLSGYAENNALGKLSTVVYCPAGMGRKGEHVLEALRAGHSVLSNGPILFAGFDRNANGTLDDADDIHVGDTLTSSSASLPPLVLEWASSAEFGPLTTIQIFLGTAQGETVLAEVSVPAEKQLASQGLFTVDLRGRLEKLPSEGGYIRLEARTRNRLGQEYRCYTNPIWVHLTEP